MLKHLILNWYVEGLGHDDYGVIAGYLQEGTPLMMAHVVDDTDDSSPYTVNVYYEDADQVNYLVGSLGDNQEILSNLIDADVAVACGVIAHMVNAPLNERLLVGVWILAEDIESA